MMRMIVRWASFAAAILLSGTAHAQSGWPTRPVQFVVPLAAGGTADGTARVLAEKLAEIWHQRVYVENKAGGNSIPGTVAIAKAAPDGYTIGMGTIGALSANPFLFPTLSYHVEKDFTPIVLIATSPVFLIVHPSVPANNLQEFIAYAKANPGKLSFASSGHGSSLHLAAEQLMQRVGIKMQHIPYRGMGAAMSDFLSGQVQVAMDVSTLAQVRDGKLKALGVASTKRFVGAPEIPSFAEQGLPDFEANTWLSMSAPAGLPAEVQRKLNADVNTALKMPDLQAKLLTMSYVADGGTPEQLTAFLASEKEKIGAIIRNGNVKVEQ